MTEFSLLIVNLHFNLKEQSIEIKTQEIPYKILLTLNVLERRGLSIANDVISNNDSLKNLQARSLAMHHYYLGLTQKNEKKIVQDVAIKLT